MNVPWTEILAGAYVAFVVVASVSLLMGRRSPASTLSWIFAFVAVPFVSGAYYLVFGPRRLQRRKRRYGLRRGELAKRVTEYLKSSRGPAPALAREAGALAEVVTRLGQGSPAFATSLTWLEDGDGCMAAIEEAIQGARHHVHLEYYIWEADRVGTRLRDALVAAARRGVQVRVVTDAMGGPKSSFWTPLREVGGTAKSFNRLRLSLKSLGFASFRTHRKIVVVDGAIGFVGGINVHEPESPTFAGAESWRDAHIRIEGEPVRRLQRLFLENWAYAGGFVPIDAVNLRDYFPPAAAEGRVPVQILASGPDDPSAAIWAFFLAAISTAKSRLLIETPYLVPDEPFEVALRIAVLRGVDVKVIVPKKGDSRLVTAASHTYCESLMNAGVSVYEFGPPMLHTKTMLVDDTVAVIGTANLDNRSFRLNFEVAAAIYDKEFLKCVEKRFEEDRALSRPFPRRHGPRLGAFLESVARLASPVL